MLKKMILSMFLFAAINSHAQTWGTPLLPVSPFTTGGNAGTYAKLLVVNGNPAMAYQDGTRSNLLFVRATDASGTAWSSPITLDSTLVVGSAISIQIVNGNPAITYWDQENGDLKYIRALDVSGAAWGTAVIVDGLTTNVGQYNSLQVVNGNPAIAYFDGDNGDLKYIRATNASGTAWGTVLNIDGATDYVGISPSLQIVNGRPAIAYMDASNGDLKYIRATDASGTAWGTALSIDEPGSVGQYASLQIVNGYPAVAYCDYVNVDLKYIRATDADGSAWGTALTIDGAEDVGLYTSLQVVNGNPAVSYWDQGNADLKFIMADDADGSAWGTALIIDGAGTNVGQYSSLKIINGNPAIAYLDGANGNLKYIRATNIEGTAWGTTLSFDVTAGIGQYNSLQIVNGNPAIAYYNATQGDLQYVRATNAAGTTWGTATTIDATGVVGYYTSLQVVNGNPAIAYFDNIDGNLKYVRASDAAGTAWGTALTIDAPGNVGLFPSLQIVNGNPAIAYWDAGGNQDLKYIRATDADGTAWGTALTIDGAGVSLGQFPSLQIVNGNPAIAYFDNTNQDLKYIRATDVTGTAWGTALTIDGVLPGVNTGLYPSLQIVNGYPAIGYYDGGISQDLKYIRATDSAGTAWGAGQTIDATGDVGQYTSLQIVSGNPAISYYDATNRDLKYIRANDISGAAWGAGVILDAAGNTGQYSSMISGGTGAMISYFSQSQQLPYFISTTVFVLPVKLINIKAYQKNTGIQVEWTAQQENNLDRYEVERSSNGLQFNQLGSVTATGNSNTISNYNFFDAAPFNGVNFYRIRSVDKDGKFTYSQVLKVNIKNTGVQTFTVYPNPVRTNNITVQLNLPKGNYIINLANAAGVQVISSSITHTGGAATRNIEPQRKLAGGIYQLTVKGEGVSITRQVIKN